MEVIAMLWLRQLKRYGRARARIVAMLAQPFLFLLALGLGFAPIFQRAGEGDYFAFLAPGVIGAGILFNAVFSGADLLWDRQFGFVKETLAAPVPRFQIMIGRALGTTTVAILQGVLIGLICMVAGLHLSFAATLLPSLALALLYAALLAFLFSLIGSILGSVLNDSQGFSLIVNFIVTPIFYLSGAIFPIDGLPRLVRHLALLNPLTFGIDGLRGALTGRWAIAMPVSLGVLVLLCGLCLAAATATFSRIKA